MNTSHHIAIIGGGPAGLRAAEVAAELGARVTVYDAMPSVGRKFLIAGKSGLNLTNGEAWSDFLEKYSGRSLPESSWRKILTDFDHLALRQWALDLGIETFVASSGKVFPCPVDGTIRAAPLLRRWIEKLRARGVVFKTRHRWIGFTPAGHLHFHHQGSEIEVTADATILALGGASWPRTGSDGRWQQLLAAQGIHSEKFTSANCGWEVDWPAEILEVAEGLPMKNLELSAGTMTRRGELVLTRYGLEGGPIYRLGPALRAQTSPELHIDFKPNTSREELVAKMGSVRRNFVREARRRWKLDAATCALLKHLPDRGPWKSAEQLAGEVKHCRIPLTGPRPIEEAISSAGGIRWNELDENLMLQKMPGVFAAGEMIDWDAPTGGYLLQACFATGDHAARAALRFLNSSA
ncbi:TIGR03862 family flavoprotein [Verrucomicrobiaceae bacterium 5K15]|uniref:TIGR03862 family flavoprotein n=1 Tax=Oceaniferula flava TaxID=2800421 RepID=A0AAE2SC59_9BACT|nr:TIGR03862 family flavoprotein [Oceaniferula flavus]MBK1853581.1 TIGR03862 family flavoprotein [Oceaniferula flavus]MBM1134886.1 TIGR03862 family flavoprotein [Oceaniferula flavus]